MDLALDVQNLSKHYGPASDGVQALAGVSFTVPRDTVFCILGPNGAGKTTLLKILTTITRPDGGTAKIEGFDLLHQPLEVRQQIGVVFQANHFDRYLSIWHNLTLHAQMHGIASAVYEKQISELLEKVDLYDRRFDLAETLSGGMQRRVALVRALIHRPKVLFLDEPTTGLDPQARREIWDTILQLKSTSTTVILTTHYMDEADFLSDSILMVNHGRCVMAGTARALKQTLAIKNRYEIVLNTPKAASYQSILAEHGLTSELSGDGYALSFLLPNPKDLPKVIALLPVEEIFRMGMEEPNLEDVFLAVASQTSQAKEESV